MKKLKIYLCDLVHNRHLYNYAVPLNIGCIGAMICKHFGSSVEVRLFKFADDLINALNEPPDILALSNYDWNVNLNRAVVDMVHRRHRHTLVVMGGPNIRRSPDQIESFLSRSGGVDMYITDEGEAGFYHLLEYVLGVWPTDIRENVRRDHPELFNVAYLVDSDSALITRDHSPLSCLYHIPYPSAWLSGLLRPFLDLTAFPLSPLVETNRGCPYQCAYCTWGNYGNKLIRKFPLEQVFEDLDYIFSTSTRPFHLIIGDANFGILERDISIAEHIRKLSERYGNVTGVEIFSSKRQLERNLTIFDILGDLSTPDYAVQTFDTKALANVGRTNLGVEEIGRFVQRINSRGRRVYTDLLVGLPGERMESHINSVKMAIDLGFCKAAIADIRLLPGSRMEEDEFRKRYGIRGLWRVIPSAYGKYAGRRVVEYEQCIRETDVMSGENFLALRLFHAFFFLLYYVEFGTPLLDFSKRRGLHPVDVALASSKKPPIDLFPTLSEQIESYMRQAASEWFDTAEEANAYYLSDSMFPHLMAEGFPKLNYLFAAQLILNRRLRFEWFAWVSLQIKERLNPGVASVVDEIARFCDARIQGYPLEDGLPSLIMSAVAIEEIAGYALEKTVNGSDTSALVEFADDPVAKSNLNRLILEYGGSLGASHGIQIALQLEPASFIRKCCIASVPEPTR